MEITSYRLNMDAWINGSFCKTDSAISMKPAEAKYWLLAGTIVQAPPSVDLTPLSVDQPAPAVDKSGRRTRE